MKINSFEDMEIWQEARELCKLVRKITIETPLCKDFSLRDQIRSSSGSVMDNIAEGFNRGGNREFQQFLWISKGSCAETRSQFYRAFDYEYIKQYMLDDLLQRTNTLSIKLSKFLEYLRNSELKGAKYH